MWVNFFELTSIPPNTAFQIQNNVSYGNILFQTSVDAPEPENKTGWAIGPRLSPTSLQAIPASPVLWVRAITETNKQKISASILY
jgi:hypothetical protein